MYMIFPFHPLTILLDMLFWFHSYLYNAFHLGAPTVLAFSFWIMMLYTLSSCNHAM